MERTAEGASTPVFRLRRGGVTLYLRLAESSRASLAPEARVHGLLRSRGVHVPEIVYFEPHNEALGRSLMVTTEIPGLPISSTHRGIDIDAVLAMAGRDLARIHSISVEGFGWIRRDQPDAAPLRAALPTLQAFALEDLPAHLAVLEGLLSVSELRAIERVIADGAPMLLESQAALVHGDFDATHIFHRQGAYTGIIDFGEMRGADPLYDLGHVALHDGETLPYPVLPALLAGYAEAMPLPPDAKPRIRLWSLLIGVRALARSVGRPQSAYQSYLIGAIRGALSETPTLTRRSARP